MTHSEVPAGYSLKKVSITQESFCEYEKPVYNRGNFVGMVDQAIFKSQRKHRATHLTDVAIFIETPSEWNLWEHECAVVTGTAVRAVRPSVRRAASIGSEEEIAPADEDMKEFFTE